MVMEPLHVASSVVAADDLRGLLPAADAPAGFTQSPVVGL